MIYILKDVPQTLAPGKYGFRIISCGYDREYVEYVMRARFCGPSEGFADKTNPTLLQIVVEDGASVTVEALLQKDGLLTLTTKKGPNYAEELVETISNPTD
jgi:hypothetical protein